MKDKAAKAKRVKAMQPSPTQPRLSRQRRPDAMPPIEWQRELRRQFGREQTFQLTSLRSASVFGEFLVSNPDSQSSYSVNIRGLNVGDNLCACSDFATNGLGTCKHIEFGLQKLQKKRGGSSAFKRGYQPLFSEVWLHHGDERTVRFRAGAGCPVGILRLADRLFDPADGHLPHDRILQLDGFVQKGRHLADSQGHELRVHDDVLSFETQARDASHRLRLLMEAYPKGLKDKGLTKLVKTRLYPYQVEGALFAAQVGRVLIADEMGLGKTVQAIAAAELMARHFGVQRVLVVCPTSLKHQWQREIERFAGRDARVLGGLSRVRHQQWQEDDFCKIVNYETLVRDEPQAKGWAPDLLIVDEAQRVKNWSTQAARTIKRISTPSVCAHVIVLTGTPLENRLEELVSIVQVVDQHRLGPTWRFMHEHQDVDEVGRVVGYRNLGHIGATLSPIMLRRRKADVLSQLPERVDKTLFVPLTPEQRVHHDENGVTVSRIIQRWRKTGYLSDTDQRRLQCALQNMRMACNSTWLLDHKTDHGNKADELVAWLEDLFEDHQTKVVIFSQWLGTHDVLIKRLAAKGWGHVFFHGGVPAEQRDALVRQFHEDGSCRLFLSTDAGSTGLNLQHAAAVVVNMDQPWNPAVLEQRIGRVHRMGQRRGVQVINLVAEASIEEGMLSILAFKQSLFSGALDGGDDTVFMEGGRLTRFIQSVDRVTEGLAMQVPPILESPDETTPSPLASTAARDKFDPSIEFTAERGAVDSTGTASAVDEPSPVSVSRDRSALWSPLLRAGLQLLDALAAPQGETDSTSALVQTDETTGERFVKLPLPDPVTLKLMMSKLQGLLDGLPVSPSPDGSVR
ncbi:MAG: hypothetical protein RLZZ618_2564 [Pseudomonadota bacterium]|jgi:superfamily II DNA or RNA helicase